MRQAEVPVDLEPIASESEVSICRRTPLIGCAGPVASGGVCKKQGRKALRYPGAPLRRQHCAPREGLKDDPKRLTACCLGGRQRAAKRFSEYEKPRRRSGSAKPLATSTTQGVARGRDGQKRRCGWLVGAEGGSVWLQWRYPAIAPGSVRGKSLCRRLCYQTSVIDQLLTVRPLAWVSACLGRQGPVSWRP